MNGYLKIEINMLRKILFILLAIVFSCACSGGSKKHNEANRVAAPAEQITEEDYNLIGENLQAFLSQNATPLKNWAFMEWGYKIPKPKGIRITGDELKEFLSIDKVNNYRPIHNVKPTVGQGLPSHLQLRLGLSHLALDLHPLHLGQ